MAPIMILIVEDDPDTCDVVALLLTSANYHVTCCSNPHEGFAQAHRLGPQLVLTDLWMGTSREAGWALIMALRGSPQTAAIPVIVYSTDEYTLRERSAILRQQRGLTLEKPFMADALLTRVGEALAL